jgi:hypothetical protein
VTDFVDFHIWPVFNLADSAIVVGAIVLALATAGGRDQGADRSPETADEHPRVGTGEGDDRTVEA